MKYNISICLMIKNDHEYIQEWLNHHRSIGIEHFYIYDNESTPPYNNLGDDVTLIYWDENYYFEPHPPIKNMKYYNKSFQKNMPSFIDLELTHYPLYPNRNDRQYKAYQHCLNNFGKDNKWIAFIDADEFIMIDDQKLKDLLDEYSKDESTAQLLLYWRTFGSSDYIKKQPKIIESYTEWFPDYQVKPIVQPEKIFGVSYIHEFTVYPGLRSINENQEAMMARKIEKHCSNKIWINHYWCKSLQDFEETKIKRKGGVTQAPDSTYIDKFNFINKRAKYHMKKYIYNK